MQVSFNKIQNYNNPQQNSFPAFKMNMKELPAVDRFVAKKYKINPQPFKVMKDFQNYCKELVEKIAKTDFGGRQQETQIQRKSMIKDWYNYVTKENDAYTGSIALMILRSITSELKRNEDTLPPVLNKGVLANTVSEIQKTLEESPNTQLNFEKTYKNNLQKSMLTEETVLDENLNGWIEIPSKQHDPENFEANVDKLKMLSHNNWCTKSYNAEPYLRDGDFHVYMENGKPKLGVRFVGGEIQEIQGELNNSIIPVKYGDIAKDHIKDYKLKENAKEEVENLELVKQQIEEFKAKFKNGIENASTQEILENYRIVCKKDSDGLLIISHYGKGDYKFTLGDLEIDENKLFKDIKIIEGDADFSGSQIIDLGDLQSIGGDADFGDSQIQSLGNLQSIGRHAFFRDSQIQSLGNLQSIGGNADFGDSPVQSLGNLQSIGRNVYIEMSPLRKKDFESIKVGGIFIGS